MPGILRTTLVFLIIKITIILIRKLDEKYAKALFFFITDEVLSILALLF